MGTLVTLTIEITKEGERTNVERFSVPATSYLSGADEFQLNLSQCLARTTKELTNPTPKTDMV